MARVITLQLLFFLLPFALYALWLLAAKRKVLEVAPWSWKIIGVLVLAGFVFAIIAFLATAPMGGGNPGQTYVPAQMKDGVLVPGHFE
jgi:hypothetical protein